MRTKKIPDPAGYSKYPATPLVASTATGSVPNTPPGICTDAVPKGGI